MGKAAPKVAIIGMACRFPGGNDSPEQLWRYLCAKGDAIRDIPRERWSSDRFYGPRPATPGRMTVKRAGMLASVQEFDAAFFGISPRIAERMDPQQRLLLEVAWEAFESAGLTQEQLAGSPTGVFVGVSSYDYSSIQVGERNVFDIDAHTATGNAGSIVANRVSYTFDLRGPSLAVDTACSSSLLAVHLAAQSLAAGESEVALACGVNLLLSPSFMLSFSHAAMLSPDGQSRAFDAGANGFVRGEGAGVVVLKPLAAALASGDRIFAVIRGSAANQDGRTKGITMPNGAAQEAVVRAALAAAGVAPGEVGFVEAHGTGTPVGDPIEANALGQALGAARTDGRVCLLGSIKTNLGHLEPAAGIAGLIKASLCVQRRQVPPNLHFTRPNPEVPFAALSLRVPTELTPWPAGYASAIAGVNSFGFGGTNVHVILEEPPALPPAPARAAAGPVVIPLAAKSAAALDDVLARFAAHLGDVPAGTPLADVAAAAAVFRSGHEHRAAVVGETYADAAAAIGEFRASGRAAGVVSGGFPAAAPPRRVAFVFNGQGPQWWAMGRELARTEPVYRGALERVGTLMQPHAPWSLLEELGRGEAQSRLGETFLLQPAMFALQVALVELWRSWGVRPDGVVGHSMGEMAAAHTAGALALADAARLVVARGLVQDRADPAGGMLYVALAADQAEELCRAHPARAWLSAQNSPKGSTLSGDLATLRQIAQELAARGVFCRVLAVRCACHSPHMDPLREGLAAALAGLPSRPPELPFYSTVHGGRAETALDAGYWWDNFRQPVLFAPAVQRMLAAGYNVFVEVGPHPVLSAALAETAAGRGAEVVTVASLRRQAPDSRTIRLALGALYCAGVAVDWRGVYPDAGRHRDLPPYPWQRQRYWRESAASLRARCGRDAHPMLQDVVDTAQPTREIRYDDAHLAWVNDHDILGAVVVPGAAHIEAALATVQELVEGPVALERVVFERAMILSAGVPTAAQVSVAVAGRTFEVHGRAVEGDKAWTRHARGHFYSDAPRPPRAVDLAQIRARCPRRADVGAMYRRLAAGSFHYGPAFRGITESYVGDGEALSRIEVPPTLAGQTAGYVFHPALLDACFQSIINYFSPAGAGAGLARSYLPAALRSVRVHKRPTYPLYCHSRLTGRTAGQAASLSIDLTLLSETGEVLAEFTELLCNAVAERTSADALAGCVYRYRWTPAPLASRGVSELRLPPPAALAAELAGEAAALAVRYGRAAHYAAARPALQELATGFVTQALTELGVRFVVGAQVEPAALPVAPRHRQLLARLLRILGEDGILARAATEAPWRVQRPPAPGDVLARWRETMRRFPAYQAELRLMYRTGTELAAVLTGAADPLPLLYPEGSFHLAEALVQNAPSARYYNHLARAVAGAVVRRLGPLRPLRVLEVGAGTGGLTTHLLPALPADRTEYWFTDLSKAFFTKAAQKFAGVPGLRYELFDVEHDPVAQGFPAAAFDLVVAFDVLHATADLKASLANVRRLLAPHGLLLLLELTRETRLLDLSFALTDGWWRFTDTALRQDGPLVPTKTWLRLFRETGFAGGAALFDAAETADPEQAVLLAQAAGGADGAAPPGAGAAPGRWLVLADAAGLGAALAGRLAAAGGSALLVFPGDVSTAPEGGRCTLRPDAPDDAQALLAGGVWQGIVHLWSLDDSPGPPTEAALRRGVDVAGAGLLSLAKAAGATGPRLARGTLVVTRKAQPVAPGDAPALAQAAIWGLAMVAMTELPGLGCRLVDLAEADPSDAALLWDELWDEGGEQEVAWRGGDRVGRRLVRAPDAVGGGEWALTGGLPAAQGFSLHAEHLGSVDELVLRVEARAAPAPTEVEIEVEASSLHFHDLMVCLGRIPVPAGHQDGTRLFGKECAGRIARVGAAATRYRPGDAVLCIYTGNGALASHLNADESVVFPLPAGLGFEAAAGLPGAYFTAWYALRELARLQRGERLLIHSAAGGVGLAALELATRAGAEVFATAGSAEKRELLTALGVRHVFDSRTLTFADEILERTGGRGVDVVLNSVAGETLLRSFECLAHGGRFVELGKRDFLADAALGLAPFLRNLTFFGFDLSALFRERRGHVIERFAAMLAELAASGIGPLPYKVFGINDARAAFRQMTRPDHVGKVVIDVKDAAAALAPPRRPPLALAPTGTWLVTGGTAGFGLRAAEWLVAAGARHLVLVSRRGVTPEAEATAAALAAQGASVTCRAVDVADRAQLAALLADIQARLPPLAGVLHAAMVLDDGMLVHLDAARLARVLEPKMFGAWHLHELTAHLPLEAFVLFSSFSSLIAQPGQGNYVAANAFLDALAHYRRARGLPALAVNWGALAQTGFVARNERVGKLLAQVGIEPLAPADALAGLGRLMQDGGPQAAIAKLARGVWTQRLAGAAELRRFRVLYASDARAAAADDDEATPAAARERLAQAPRAARPGILQALLVRHVGAALGVAVGPLAVNVPLTDLGLDSLLAVEILTWVEATLAVDLPLMELMKGPTIDELAGALLARLDGEAAAAPAEAAEAGGWIRIFVPRPAAALRLVCIPYLAGGPSAYLGWAKAAPVELEILALQPPGKEARAAEAPLTRMAPVVQGMADALMPLLDRPFAIYGHSMGSLIAFELARELRRRGRHPVHFFAGAYGAPQLGSPYPGAAGDVEADDAAALFTDDMVTAFLRKTDVTEAVMADAKLREKLFPTIKADIVLAVRYRFAPEPPLACPVTTILGARDRLVAAHLVPGWAEHTAAAYTHHAIDGNHLFLEAAADQVLGLITAALGLLGRPPK